MKRDPRLIPLSWDHQRGLALALRARKCAASGSASDVESLWAELRAAFDAELEPHFALEEQHLLPALAACGETALVERTLDEHRRLRALVAGLPVGVSAAPPDAPPASEPDRATAPAAERGRVAETERAIYPSAERGRFAESQRATSSPAERGRVAETERATPPAAERAATLERFGTLLADHIRFEERELFERAQQLLSAPTLDAIGRALGATPVPD